MKNSFTFIFGSFLLLSLAACDASKTASTAPDNVNAPVEVPNAQEATEAKEDATSETRRRQLNADIRASEERNNTFNDGNATNRDDSNVASEVRSKLEANLPASALVIEAENGNINVKGTVPTQAQYDRIANLTKEIKGVKNVTINVAVAPAKPEANN